MPAQGSGGSSSSSFAMGARKPEAAHDRDRTDKKRKADEEHSEDPERSDGKCVRSEGPKRKGEDEDEESRLKKTIKYLKKLDEAEANAGIAEVEVNEEDPDAEGAGEMQAEEGEQELGPVQVQQERKKELQYIIKTLQLFEFGSLQEATSRGGKAPTTTKWVDRTRKDDDGKEFVRCGLVARDAKPKPRRTEGRLVCGDATAGGEEGHSSRSRWQRARSG